MDINLEISPSERAWTGRIYDESGRDRALFLFAFYLHRLVLDVSLVKNINEG
ncbi:MAG: hypothetical protein JJE09_13275 [Bacteroidia bacterium]|nr:hypothetical protein [Bacteroidia bacterium]